MAVELVEVVVVALLVQQVSMELELEMAPVLSRLVSLSLCARCPLEWALVHPEVVEHLEAQEDQEVGHPLV